ncbi:helix-turn-helix domain-containing protein [Oceanirhabdus seepicola]|uniref:Helix-turn-helix domain-containing protein n=1 Tax=Oceanirhabdus seepicola TaxID=2828781 RepID=A0A9J6P5C3_9CLOT|nr:helix-turn-helix domain-containing protein [Oceanirhabdus seepicola]MCM1991297.1 helix-turn-helix domain-containing protein [Oceanirhabdus seepicola]
MSSNDYLYTVDEISQILKVNKNFVYDLIKAGHIIALKLGRYKITRLELLRFLEESNGKDFSDVNDVKELVF